VPRVKPEAPKDKTLKSTTSSPAYYWHGSDSSVPGPLKTNERAEKGAVSSPGAASVGASVKKAALVKKAAPRPAKRKAKNVSAASKGAILGSLYSVEDSEASAA